MVVVVIDTNVWISALMTPRGAARHAVLRAAEFAEIAMTERTLAELERKLVGDKFAAAISAGALDALMDEIIHRVAFHVPPSTARRSRDPDDDIFLDLALAVEAAFLITGDKDLLDLAPTYSRRGLAIVAPRSFLVAAAAYGRFG